MMNKTLEDIMLLIYLTLIDNPEDNDKFKVLYEEYKEKMFYVANQKLNNIHSAEDAVHEAFIRIIKNLHKIDDVYCPQTKNYLLIIVKNVALSMITSNRNNEISMSDNEFVWEEDSGFNLEDECLSQINYEIIVDIIPTLPDIYKDAIYLECVMEMSIAEIAGMLSINKETAKKRLQRGRKLLIEKLEKEAIVYGK